MMTFFESYPTNETKTCFALAISEFASTYSKVIIEVVDEDSIKTKIRTTYLRVELVKK